MWLFLLHVALLSALIMRATIAPIAHRGIGFAVAQSHRYRNRVSLCLAHAFAFPGNKWK
jgi:hypothetical protein